MGGTSPKALETCRKRRLKPGDRHVKDLEHVVAGLCQEGQDGVRGDVAVVVVPRSHHGILQDHYPRLVLHDVLHGGKEAVWIGAMGAGVREVEVL